MKRILTALLLSPVLLFAQKKPLDHTVYDGWQSIGEKIISNDGRWLAWTVTPQEGDADLFVQSANGFFKKQIPRGYNATITEDSRFLVFEIKPLYQDSRNARIKKKKPEDMPKDSFGILELGKDSVIKVARVASYKTPEKVGGWVAYLMEKKPAPAGKASPTQKTVDSLTKKIDSLVMLVTELKNIKGGNSDAADADETPNGNNNGKEGSDLHLRNLAGNTDLLFPNVVDYSFNKYGQKLVMRISRSAKDSTSKNAVVIYDLQRTKADTILKGGNDFRNFAFTENGERLAFAAERDTNTKALQKFYDLYVYHEAEDSAHLLINKMQPGMQLGMTVSENGQLRFSKSGDRLFFGTAPIPLAKDTSLVDIDLVKLDIWNYKDDYLQTQQLFNLQNELKRNYLAVYNFSDHEMQQLGSPEFPMVMQSAEGDGKYFVAATDTGRRVQAQWLGRTDRDIYAVDVNTGEKILVKKNLNGQAWPSSTGRYIIMYDAKAKNYLLWNGKQVKNITAKIPVPLWNEENDVPADPGPYGIMGWQKDDAFVYIYDRYDIWKVDPTGVKAPVRLQPTGRAAKLTSRYVKLDRDEEYLDPAKTWVFRRFDNVKKNSGYASFNPATGKWSPLTPFNAYAYNGLEKAKDQNTYIYTRESYTESPDLHLLQAAPAGAKDEKLTALNPQQDDYNWGTASLYKWTTFKGKPATGVLYKPEDFDPKKKYPMIIYFYEKVSDNLNNYQAPAPTPSRLNIPFFVSRGYLVFTPDISYTKGHPGKDAYDYIVSGAKALAKLPWVDAKNIGIQGQSWGGYQVAYLITATDMFKAAWAGAPVVNMFSAYGGIRWQSGLNRQFQYEQTQSRIGATPWQRPDLYIENSPLFHLPKVKTPLVIMANDADGAVPWYQGIEFFTAMRRLGKPVWLLNYNGEAHNLVERKNRKDIQIREQQFFDWLLKGEQPPRWITEGVPAINKGKDWGLELVF